MKKSKLYLYTTVYVNCRAEYIKMPSPLLIFSQSDYFIQIVDINSHPYRLFDLHYTEKSDIVFTLTLVMLNKLRCHTHF